MISLQKAIQTLGISRRKSADKILKDGILVNSKIIKEPWYELEEEDTIKYEGKTYKISELLKRKEEKVYYLINKPLDVICAMEDPFGRKTISDLIKNKIKEKVFHVGRLDLNSSGLLLLTNDGDLANKLLHPKHEISKTYTVIINGHPTREDLKKIENGVVLETGYKTNPAKIEKVKKQGSNHEVTITINEGKKRQVRLMFKVIGFKVKELKRIKFGPFSIKEVPNPGNIKKIDPEIIKNFIK
ncbi:rRNA pseudouridine synthase [Oceanotoga sp. DSM 15011]|jgi:23S rRNA pseudouridine2605 synthase|uniref:Pseudouridine synthase n=1 Tax=Oceanotoga teriensis TaxID=515440 RepID=A0AA45C8V2_9BACT|nr:MULTISPECIES: pseudouridine synthase [Oceanotoga]MDN5342074.1 rRNA synthase [Oceanotoga sp.]MDO7975456.1 rRNA pseudouridine synthase [Oceanotoga teriensis]PWJ96256.1 ribosomal large subunit pseudouridine synthase B [Oceanotoga teriensis]UYP00040.1 rRNA pseudouridine synthase [Oceanotoga sp. DSM 15011]